VTQFFTIDQAADLLGVDRSTIRRAIASGRLQASRLGPRLIRISAEALDAYLRPIS
jgi:excisionase family DNA binding protein